MGKQSLKDKLPSEVQESGALAQQAERLFGHDLSPPLPDNDGHHTMQAVLVTSREGIVREVLQAPDTRSSDATKHGDPDTLLGEAIDVLWPGEPRNRLQVKIKAALRSRQVQSTEFATGPASAFHDFIIIPQGPDRAIVVVRDVSARQSAYSRMERLAYLDDATQLPNRLFLLTEIERCTEALRLQEGRAAVLCFDVHAPETRLGTRSSKQHDAVFAELASRLTHELRGVNDTDIDDSERYSVAARIEHQQFGVLLPRIDSGEDAESVVQRLIETLEQPITLPHKDVKLRVSAGIALFPQDGTEADALYANATAAMEDARNNQSAPYKFHSGTVRLRALQRQDLELELRTALERNEFALEFLPIVNAATHVPLSMEALLRWPQKVFGSQSIQKVISIAENTGLILPIGDWVLRHSCQALKAWHENGADALRLSVNLSVQEFARDDLVTRIAGVLQESGVAAQMLDLEINEYALFRDAMKGFVTLQGLQELGVGVVLDDYGTGACSLAHVARSSVNAIKIDNSFVANLEAGGVDASACAALAAMASQLGVRVIAEGVETAQQVRTLTGLGCGELQGFHFSRPLPGDEVADYVQRVTVVAGDP